MGKQQKIGRGRGEPFQRVFVFVGQTAKANKKAATLFEVVTISRDPSTGDVVSIGIRPSYKPEQAPRNIGHHEWSTAFSEHSAKPQDLDMLSGRTSSGDL